jgi:EAL domain-containing protein (putative c-di-GMP-specific phosphodiesterase class I)
MSARGSSASVSPLPVSVNQSKLHMEDPQYLTRLGEILEKYGIPKKVIEFELTESAFADEELIRDFSGQVHKMGFLLSIDDFGSGYSSLHMLNKVQLDILKIDRYFLSETDTSARSRILFKKIVELAKELNMDVICEGVETQQQVDFLLEIGCRYAQGFLYSHPMTQQDFIEYIGRSLI